MVKKIKFYNSFKVTKIHQNSILLVGNFDGLHLGHQKLFNLAKKYKKKFNLKIGGKVIYFGKPYPEVYNQATKNNKKKIITIGDNLRTDIKGANNMGYDSLVITRGVHNEEFKKEGIEKVLKNYNVKSTFSQSILKW